MSLLKNDFFELSAVSEDALNRRLSNSDEYSAKEIEEVASFSERLFPPDFEITTELTENFRVLTRHSKVELRPKEISSHRKFVGPIIVAFKSVLFKLMGVILKDTLASQEIFNRYVVKALAKESEKKLEGQIHSP